MLPRFKATPLALPEILLIAGPKIPDGRGHFCETFRKNDFAELGIDCDFVQENVSTSVQRGALRGLHFQAPPHAQAKLVQVMSGSIFDVAVDIRKGSPRYGQWCSRTLTAEENEQIFVPHGFAHGFCCLTDHTVVSYKVDSYYHREAEGGIAWNDRDLAIQWPTVASEAVLSEKDGKLLRLADLISPFEYRA